MSKVHAMIDIETLGGPPDGSLISFGACLFTIEDGVTDKLIVNLKGDKRGIDEDTVMWWLQQTKEAQEALFTPPQVPAKEARQIISRWFEARQPQFVWANGAAFDLTIMKDFYKGYPPWKFKSEMCMRSIRTLGAYVGLSYGDWWSNSEWTGTHHSALDDAVRQANYVIDVFRKVQNG